MCVHLDSRLRSSFPVIAWKSEFATNRERRVSGREGREDWRVDGCGGAFEVRMEGCSIPSCG